MSAGARALIILLAALGGLLARPSLCAAQKGPLAKPTLPEAREHLALGNKLYNVRSFDDAVIEYKAGTLIEPAPVFDYNLGQCYRLTGKYQDAIWHYERFLARGKPQGELLDAVNDFIAQMKSELGKKAMTQQPTEPAPTGSSGAAQGVPSGTTASVSTQTSPSSPTRSGRQRVGSSFPWYDDITGWVLTGAGVIGLASGAGLLINSASLSDKANSAFDQKQYAHLHDQARSRTWIGVAIGTAGTALLVTGIIKLVAHPESSLRTASLSITATDNSLSVHGEF